MRSITTITTTTTTTRKTNHHLYPTTGSRRRRRCCTTTDWNSTDQNNNNNDDYDDDSDNILWKILKSITITSTIITRIVGICVSVVVVVSVFDRILLQQLPSLSNKHYFINGCCCYYYHHHRIINKSRFIRRRRLFIVLLFVLLSSLSFLQNRHSINDAYQIQYPTSQQKNRMTTAVQRRPNRSFHWIHSSRCSHNNRINNNNNNNNRNERIKSATERPMVVGITTCTTSKLLLLPEQLQHQEEQEQCTENNVSTRIDETAETSTVLYRLNLPKLRQRLFNSSLLSLSSSSVAEQQKVVFTSLVQMGIQQKQQQQQQQQLLRMSEPTTNEYSSNSRDTILSFPVPQRVKGCISTVYIQTSIRRCTRNEQYPNDPSNNYSFDSMFYPSRTDDGTTDTKTTTTTRTITTTTTTNAKTSSADSYMSWGFLHCIEQLLHQVPIHEILSLQQSDICYITQYLFSSTTTTTNNVNRTSSETASSLLFLSKSRNDGFTKMILLIQDQIRHMVTMQQQQQQHQQQQLNAASSLEVAIQATTHPAISSHHQLRHAAAAAAAAAASFDPNAIRNESDLSFDLLSTPEEQKDINKTTINVALLLSGGVDSSVALNMLVRGDDQGDGGLRNRQQQDQSVQYNVTAFYLKIWLEDELSNLNSCPWEDDITYCQKVCEQLSNKTNMTIPLHTISLQEEYNQYILQYTINEAKLGRTPNPDIVCNQRIKFGCFYQYIFHTQHDCTFDYIATGHYAQIINQHRNKKMYDTVQLHRAPDPVKDQSYFLCALSQEQLQRIIFPIGHLTKQDVRSYADQYDLPNRYRPDSQGLCFLGKVKFDTFLNNYISDQPGPIIDAMNSNIIGYHRGLWYHTIGQRKGLGKVLFANATSLGPWYVLRKDSFTNTIYCTNSYDEEQFASIRSEFAVEAIHWIANVPPLASLLSPQEQQHNDDYHHEHSGSQEYLVTYDLTMKIRHGPNLVRGFLTVENIDLTAGKTRNYEEMNPRKSSNLSENERSKGRRRGYIRLANNSKDSGLAPGQYVAFYNRDSTECYGSAVICEMEALSFVNPIDKPFI